MKFRKFHELIPWDERHIFRLHEGRKLQGNHSPEDWQRSFASRRPTPSAPPVRVEIMESSVLIYPEESDGQLELGAIAAGLGHFKVTNSHDSFDPRLPFRLYPLIGRDAFTKPNSWRRRTWRIPMEVAREGQYRQEAWDIWHDALSKRPARSYAVAELNALAASAVTSTMTFAERMEFLRANR